MLRSSSRAFISGGSNFESSRGRTKSLLQLLSSLPRGSGLGKQKEDQPGGNQGFQTTRPPTPYALLLHGVGSLILLRWQGACGRKSVSPCYKPEVPAKHCTIRRAFPARTLRDPA